MGGNPTLEEFGKKFRSFQFVVLHHQFLPDSDRKTHWDLLLEHPNLEISQLLTFEVPAPPQKWEETLLVRQLPDHRPMYLAYEGPIAGNRGFVNRILKGTLKWVTFEEKLLILNLQFGWGNASENPTMEAVLELTKTAVKDDRNWAMKMQFCT